MSQQQQLDELVRELCTFLDQYTSFGVKETRIQKTDQYLLGKIEEVTGGQAIELWSEDIQEITMIIR